MGRRENLLPGDEFNRLMVEQEIDVLTLPPSVLSAMGTPPRSFQTVNTLVAAGEACTKQIADEWAPICRMLNAYGPTETTVCASISDSLAPEAQPPIGRPMTNMTAFVVDSAGDPVPIGVIGELLVGGLGLTRGYVTDPALTAARFVPDYLSGASGQRLYRTGDRVRWRPNGELEYVGRVDQQVKIRGHRVEVSEIEHIIERHQNVDRCVVVAREEHGHRRLVAYVVRDQAVAARG